MEETLKLNRQAVRSRQMLQAAMIEMLKEKPYDKITIADIIRRADLTRPTFYAHFDTKDDLLTGLIDDIFDTFSSAFYENAQYMQNDQAYLLKGNTILFQQLGKYSEIYKVIRAAGKTNVILEKLISFHTLVYKKIISRNQPEMKPAMANFFIQHISRTTITLLNYWFDQDLRHSEETMAKILSTLSGPITLEQIRKEFAQEFDY